MASSSSHNNDNIPLSTLLEWYKIRDTCFGQNRVPQNIPWALHLAAFCEHPDARWLTEVCAGKKVKTVKDAKRLFSGLGEDARALCFVWLLDERQDSAPLHRSAELGFAWAQALVARFAEGEEMFRLAQLAASQGERAGFVVLGCCFRDGFGCSLDLDKAKENFLRSCELGDVFGMRELAELLDDSDPQRWRWFGRAAALRYSWCFLEKFAALELSNSGSVKPAVMFAIGQALRGHVNEQTRTVFNNRDYSFDSLVGPAKQAIAFYEVQIKATKDAMHAWTLVGIKLKVVKDVRKLIAKLIWDSREEALFTV